MLRWSSVRSRAMGGRMNDLVRALRFPCEDSKGAESALTREWLVTNGLGGYASGTICGVPTRRYHGLLVAALPPPLGRTMMLNQINERLGTPGGTVEPLGVEALAGRPLQTSTGRISEFRLET